MSWSFVLSQSYARKGKTYPTHILGPFPKVIRCLSNLGLSIHRSGRKSCGCGKTVGFVFIVRISILTAVPAGIDHSFFVELSLYTRAASGDIRSKRAVPGLCRRRPSWITAERYGSVSSSALVGTVFGSGRAAASSSLSLRSLSGLARR